MLAVCQQFIVATSHLLLPSQPVRPKIGHRTRRLQIDHPSVVLLERSRAFDTTNHVRLPMQIAPTLRTNEDRAKPVRKTLFSSSTHGVAETPIVQNRTEGA